MKTAIIWFRNDLRVADNPALEHALRYAERVIPLYIHTPHERGDWAPGAATRWWLHHSLAALDQAVQARGARLLLRTGPSLEVLRDLIDETRATLLCWNRLYEPAQIARDKAIKQELADAGIEIHSFNGALIAEPWETLKADGEPYRVFTPFWKAMLRNGIERLPLAAPQRIPGADGLSGVTLDALGLLPRIGWDAGLQASWTPGEDGAWQQLETFADCASAYHEARDIPARPGTSRLSPHLHFGEISPRQIVQVMQQHVAGHEAARGGIEAYLRELGWREFAYHLLYHFPATPTHPLDPRFRQFPWAEDYADALSAWQRGQTGIPIVDAGMRELWQTGWMHNRVRMLVASLLTKNLLIPWQKGASWFWDTLVDADLANNTLGWQWTAGCGADAAPYFRIFNPVTQGERFDPKGDYVRRFVPELARLPDKYIHAPWLAPANVLAAAGVKLGDSYPLPIVDLKATRARALERFETIKKREK